MFPPAEAHATNKSAMEYSRAIGYNITIWRSLPNAIIFTEMNWCIARTSFKHVRYDKKLFIRINYSDSMKRIDRVELRWEDEF